MSYRSNCVSRSLCVIALIVTSQAATSAEPPQSLADKRLSIFKGTAPGIVIMDFGSKPRTVASAPKSSEAALEARTEAKTEVNASNTVTAQPPAVSGFFGSLPPPSGRPLQSARRLDAPDQGIVMPTAGTAPKLQTEPATKR